MPDDQHEEGDRSRDRERRGEQPLAAERSEQRGNHRDAEHEPAQVGKQARFREQRLYLGFEAWRAPRVERAVVFVGSGHVEGQSLADQPADQAADVLHGRLRWQFHVVFEGP